MGFDNECILNIQSLPGEYFCPVCRTLVYPNEALQAACTHLFCKPCLAYTVATTSACPYDGYLVSETDAKPLVESGKPIVEAIEKIQVHCLYHRSGCQWQGTLSECINHCTSCTFGNSPVVCNRCGAQIVHRQVQEHAQTCPGVQPQAQQVDPLQSQSSALQSQALAQSVPPASQQSSSKPGASAATAASGSTSIASLGTAAAPVIDSSAAAVATTAPVQIQPTVASQPQVAAQAPTQEQWYQQYYQQYSGFDPYQQQYQQYGYYQQQAQQQPSQTYGQSHPVQGQQPPQSYVQQYPQALPQPQVQLQYPQVHGQPHTQAYGQHHPHVQPHAHPQVQIHSQSPTVPVGQQVQAQAQPLRPQKQVPGQLVVQQQSQIPQLHAHALPHAQLPHLQHQPRPQQQQPTIGPNLPAQSQQLPIHAQYQSHPNFHGHTQLQPTNPQLHVQSQAYPRPHSTSQPPLQPQLQSQVQTQRPPHPLNQGQSQAIPQSQTQLPTAPAHTVTGHQSFPQSHLQHQMPGAGVHQRPIQMHLPHHGHLQQQHHHPVLMQDQSQMRTSHQMTVQGQQQASVSSTHGSHPQFPSGQHPSLPPAQNQVQHPTNVQAPRHPITSVYQPQISPHHNQVQHQGSSQPHNQTQQDSQHQGQMSLSQEHLPQPQFQPDSRVKTQSIPANHILSHLQSKPSPVESHNLPLESDNIESQLPSSPSSLKPSVHEETDYGVSKAGFLELASHETDVTTNVENNTDEEKEDKIDEQSDKETAGSVGNDVAMTFVKADTTASDISQHGVSLEHKDGDADEKLVRVEEVGSKSDGSDRRLSDGPGKIVNLGKIQMRDDTSGIPPSRALADQAPQPLASQDSIISDERLNLKGPHEEPVGGPVLDRIIPGYPDKIVPALPNQVHPSDDPRNILPPTQMQPNPEVVGTSSRPLTQHHGRHVHGPSYMQDASSQRPPVVDRVLPKQMPYLVPQQEKMFQETSPRVLPHVRPLTSNQVRPSLAPMGNNPTPVFQGSHVPFAQGSSFMPPVGSQLQSHVPVLQAYDASGMPTSSQVERFSGVPIQGPPSGPFGPGISMNGRVPLTHSEGQPLRSLQPSSYDGSHDRIHLMATEGFAPGNQAGEQFKMTATNGFPGHTDSSLPHALVGERFMLEDNRKLIAAEGFGPPADPNFRPYGDPVRRVVDRRKLEEDLKQFPRPSELDSRGGAKFGAYAMPSAAPFDRSSYSDNASRTFDRGMPGFHPEAPSGVGVNSPISTKSMPIYKAGSHIPISNDVSSLHQIESIDRQRLFNAGHSEFHRSGSEFGNHRMDNSHQSRSPGIELSGLPTNRFGSIVHGLGGPGHTEGFGVQASGLLPNHLRMSNGIMPGMRGGDRTDRDMMPNKMRSGDPFGAGPGSFLNHLPGGKLGVLDNVTPDMYSRDFFRFGDYQLRDFSSDQHSLSSGSFKSGHDSLDNSRKRKENSTGWCLICNIYCDTDEGRNLHYQTLEHQNRTMDIVSSIKQRYSKKLIVSSEEHDESNKSRKADVEDRPNRHQ